MGVMQAHQVRAQHRQRDRGTGGGKYWITFTGNTGTVQVPQHCQTESPAALAHQLPEGRSFIFTTLL